MPPGRPRFGSGGEGGIRTHAAFADRFSRAAPSTTRTPLRARGYQRRPRPAHGVPERGGSRPRPWPAISSSASPRRMPDTTSSAATEPRVPRPAGAPCRRRRRPGWARRRRAPRRRTRASRPTHIGHGSRVVKIVTSASDARARACARPRGGPRSTAWAVGSVRLRHPVRSRGRPSRRS